MESMNQNLASRKFDEAWNALASGNPEKAYRIINRIIWGGKSYRVSRELSNELYWLQNYEYPELKNVSNEVKRDFILVVSWNLLMKDSRYQIYGWALRENLSPFLGVDYNLDVDIENIKKDIGRPEKSLELSEEQRAKYWRELPRNSSLSLLARSLFIRILKYAQVKSGGLTDSRNVGPIDADEIKQALQELSQSGLIKSDLTSSDLLMNGAINELKKFAFESGFDIHGTKYQIVQAIILGVQKEKINHWLHERNQLNLIRPLVADFQLLKEYIWSATNDIDLYLQWLQQIKYLGKSIETIANEREDKMEAYRYRPLEPYRPLSKISIPSHVWKTKRMKLLHEIWDTECDILLRKVSEKYAWDWELYIEEAINSQLSQEKVISIRQACNDSSYIRYFCQKRLSELGIDVHKPRLLICSGCGKNFMGWSVENGLAERVAYKIHFCKECYIKAFWGSSDATIDSNKMLEQLSTVATILGVVPTSSFRSRNLNLSKLTEEN